MEDNTPNLNEFITKDSGSRRVFLTGSRRDTDVNKPRYDLIWQPGLERLALLMGRGAQKYGERNWEKGQPVSVFYASAMRHINEVWMQGDESEDHLAAALFNILGIMYVLAMIRLGLLPEDLDDRTYRR